MGSVLISFKDVAFGYGRAVVLDHIHFDICFGDFIGVVGPNGAGKSTLLKGCLGLIPPMSGKIHYASSALRISFVPQRDHLSPLYPLTAADVVEMGLVAQNPWWQIRPRGRRAQLLKALEQVGLVELADQAFSTLSGGQRQRVLIARALVVSPDLIVLDEPMTGLDRESEEAILQLLSSLHQSQQKTILMVSHHVEKMKPNITKLMTVDEGKVHV